MCLLLQDINYLNYLIFHEARFDAIKREFIMIKSALAVINGDGGWTGTMVHEDIMFKAISLILKGIDFYF